MTYYIAMDIDCIECGEESDCLGIFSDKEKAQAALTEAQEKQKRNWKGDHYFVIYEINNVINELRYENA